MKADWLRPQPKKFILPAIIIILLAIVTINNYVSSNRIISMAFSDSNQLSISEEFISSAASMNTLVFYSNTFFESIYPFHISPGQFMPKGNNVEYTYLNEENYNKVRLANEKTAELQSESEGSGNGSGAGLMSMFASEKDRSPIFPIIIEAIVLGLVAYVINSLIFIRRKPQ